MGRAAFSSEARQRIVSGSNERTLKVWDAQSGQETLKRKICEETGAGLLSGNLNCRKGL
jgi:WD40 repeat protein